MGYHSLPREGICFLIYQFVRINAADKSGAIKLIAYIANNDHALTHSYFESTVKRINVRSEIESHIALLSVCMYLGCVYKTTACLKTTDLLIPNGTSRFDEISSLTALAFDQPVYTVKDLPFPQQHTQYFECERQEA